MKITQLARLQRSTEAGNCRFGRFRSSIPIRYRSTCQFLKHLLRPELRLLAGASAKRNRASAKKNGAPAFWPKLRLYRFLRIRPKELRTINEADLWLFRNLPPQTALHVMERCQFRWQNQTESEHFKCDSVAAPPETAFGAEIGDCLAA